MLSDADLLQGQIVTLPAGNQDTALQVCCKHSSSHVHASLYFQHQSSSFWKQHVCPKSATGHGSAWDSHSKPPPAVPSSSPSPGWFCSPCAKWTCSSFLGRDMTVVKLPKHKCGNPEPVWLCTWLYLVCGMLLEQSGASSSSLQDKGAGAEWEGRCTSGVEGVAHLVHSVLPESHCHVTLWTGAWGSLHSRSGSAAAFLLKGKQKYPSQQSLSSL